MPGPYRITDLTSFSIPPTGNELAEISNAGAGSFSIPIAVLAAARPPTIVNAPSTVTVGANGYGDVLVNIAGAVTVNLPAASTRSGVPVSIVDIGGNATAHNITINANGAETIKGSSSLTISANYGGVTLWPISTGNWYTK